MPVTEERFLELCELAARDAGLSEEVIGQMTTSEYAPYDDLAGDENGHFVWLTTLEDRIAMETNLQSFDFQPPPERDLNQLSLGELFSLMKHPHVREKAAFHEA